MTQMVDHCCRAQKDLSFGTNIDPVGQVELRENKQNGCTAILGATMHFS